MALRKFGGIRVVVIDDDAMLRELLVQALNRYGYMAKGVDDSRQADEAVALHGAQIVLCDIKMPGLDGLELTRRLKARDGGTQVILMTGYPDQDTVDEAFHLGADGYLIKPFVSLDTVYKAVDKSAGKLRQWEKTMRAAVEADFPEEYNIIYNPDVPVPDTDEMEALIVEAAPDEGTVPS